MFKRALACGLAVVAALAVLTLAAAHWVSRPLFKETLETATMPRVQIAAAETALSFVRYQGGDEMRVLLVTQLDETVAEGVDASAYFAAPAHDPLALYANQGHEALVTAVQSGARIRVPRAQWRLPFDVQEANIGIGTNYLEHARESQVKEEPFVFPKRVRPTAADADVAQAGATHLDYEAELGFVALSDLRAGDTPTTMGLVLVNDYTDRGALVRHFDGQRAMGQTGFVDGKSRAGYAPIGPLLVIPRDLENFYRRQELQLYVNGHLRQRELAGAMIWGPAEMLRESLARADGPYDSAQGPVPLLSQPGVIARGTLILSGTPSGVIFRPLNLIAPWVYLQPGDVVITHSPALGTLRNRITP